MFYVLLHRIECTETSKKYYLCFDKNYPNASPMKHMDNQKEIWFDLKEEDGSLHYGFSSSVYRFKIYLYRLFSFLKDKIKDNEKPGTRNIYKCKIMTL